MGKIKKFEHKQNKFEQHIENLDKKIQKKDQKLQQVPKLQQKRNVQEEAQKKKNLFALDSDNEQEEQKVIKNWKFTHNGQDLQEDYNDQIPVSSDDELPKGFVKNNHFVGFDQNQDKRKSKKEIYDEIIQNSKQRKADKQKLKEGNQIKILQLNEALPQILDILPIKQSKPQAPTKEGLDYFELMETFKAEPKVQIETIVQSSEKDQTNYMRQKREEAKKKKIEENRKEIERDSEDEDEEEIENDDCVSKQFKNAKEKKMLKSYKKVEHLSKVMEHLRNVQNKKKTKLVNKIEKQNNEDENEEDEEEDLNEILSDEDDSEDYENEDNDNEDEDDEDDEDDDENEGEENDDEDDEDDDENDQDDDDDENNENDEEDEEIGQSESEIKPAKQRNEKKNKPKRINK